MAQMTEDYSQGAISYADEDEELLFGPDGGSEEEMAMAARNAFTRKPKNLEKYLPALVEASRQPDAPAELLDFVRVISYHLGQGV